VILIQSSISSCVSHAISTNDEDDFLSSSSSKKSKVKPPVKSASPGSDSSGFVVRKKRPDSVTKGTLRISYSEFISKTVESDVPKTQRKRVRAFCVGSSSSSDAGDHSPRIALGSIDSDQSIPITSKDSVNIIFSLDFVCT
jgi:hypothetical protein